MCSRPLVGCACGGDALLRREVPALGASPQHAQVVRHGVHEAPLGQLLQPVAQRGGRDAPEAGQLLHGGEGRSAQQQERLLTPLAQGAQRGVGPQALQVDDDLECGRFNRSDAAADRAQDGGRHGAPMWPCSRKRQRVWRETPRSSAALRRPCSDA